MRAVRRVAMVVAFLSWIFCWSLLRDVRAVFDGSDGFGGVPAWLTGVLGLALLLTIGTAITAAIRLPVWPYLALAAGIFLFLGVIGAHLADLQALARLNLNGPPPNPFSAFKEGFTARGLQPVFFVGGSSALVATGIYGWLNGPRSMFAPEPAPSPPSEPRGPHAI